MSMSENELYIGIPNGIVLCMDGPIHWGQFPGRVYHGYRVDGARIGSFEQLINIMGHLFDELQFPRASMRDRSFAPEHHHPRQFTRRKDRVMSDKEMLAKHGEIGTFIIRVQQRQNSTWQGRITWVEKDKTIRFRSILEMIKLIESGILQEYPELVEEEEPSWD